MQYDSGKLLYKSGKLTMDEPKSSRFVMETEQYAVNINFQSKISKNGSDIEEFVVAFQIQWVISNRHMHLSQCRIEGNSKLLFFSHDE
jgi:hypothetical protein